MRAPQEGLEWLSPAEYLERERRAPRKSEYINGTIYAMAGASRQHVRISASIVISLGSQLKGKSCEPFNNDLRVKVPRTTLYTYPDVLVACPPMEWEDDEFDTLLNPTVIVEVLSPSTKRYDRGDKWAHYQRLNSLRDYILVSQDECRVEHYTRLPDNRWELAAYEDLADAFPIESIGCTLALRDVYDRITFAPPADSDGGAV